MKKQKKRKVARILVNLNVREGLGEEIDFSWGNCTLSQILDYENVPFRCRRCHQYGHLIKNSSMPVRTRGLGYKSDKGFTQFQEDRIPIVSSNEGKKSTEEQI